MLCPRIGVARGHVSCGSLSRSDSSLEDGREPEGTDKTEQLIMSRTGSSQEGFGMMFACNCFIPQFLFFVDCKLLFSNTF